MNQHVLLDPDQAFQGLTAKQENYCYWRFQGMSQIDAYRKAYNPPASSDRTLQSHAVQLERDDRIVERLGQMVRERQEVTSLALPLDRKELRERIVNDVYKIATDEANKIKDRLTGYTFLAKVTGVDLFVKQHESNDKPATIEDIDKRLAELLGGITLDAVPGITAPEAAKPIAAAARGRRTPAKRRDKTAPGK